MAPFLFEYFVVPDRLWFEYVCEGIEYYDVFLKMSVKERIEMIELNNEIISIFSHL